eukprot:gene8552-10516_t
MVNFNIDSLFDYQTVKIVRIRDRRLGILHLVFLFAIICYISVGTIVLEKKYLATELPIGSIRSSLMEPSEEYKNDNPPYCSSAGPEYMGFPTKQCQWWDETLVLYPPSSESSIFVTTRVTSSQERLNNCSLTSPNCRYTDSQDQNFFIADVDNFTILIDHTLSAPTLGIQYNAKQLAGKLLDSKGNDWTPPEPNVVGVPGEDDILTLDTIIQAAGLDSLDDPGLANSSRSIRDDGLLIMCFITYSNTFSFNPNRFRYTYQFSLIQNTKFKIVEPIYTTGIDDRYVINRHGVRIIFIQTGTLGKFDFQVMLLTFVSGIGLVTVATFIVDLLAVRLLPQRSRYQKLKYQESEKIINDDIIDETSPLTT